MTKAIVSLDQKKAKCCLIIWGITYLYLFLFLLFFLGGCVYFRLVEANTLAYKLFILMDLIPILSIPLTYFFMVLNYKSGHYKKIHFFWLAPIVVSLLIFFVNMMSAWLFLITIMIVN